MQRSNLILAALLAVTLGLDARAELIPVKHRQLPRHAFMVTRSEAGAVIARVEFTQTVQGDQVTMRLTSTFADGSVEDETTTFTQQGTFRLVRDHHTQKGSFFTRPFDFAVDAASGTATTRTVDRNGKTHVEIERRNLPEDLANGFVGTLLLNVPQNKAPFRVGLLAPVGGGRLLQLLISPEGEQPFQRASQARRASVFRIHPELGGIVGFLAQLIGVQPKDVRVWVEEGDDPEVVRVVGQLGGYGPVVSSELDGTTFGK